MQNLKTFILIIAAISFIIVIGGAVYEHVAEVPVWSSAAPASLSMFQGEYGLAAFRFWMPIHPITVLLLLSALILNWNTDRRKYILITLGGYAAILAVTFLFFVPELMSITTSSYSNLIDTELTRRANNWETYSLIRLGVLLILAVSLQYGLSRPGNSRKDLATDFTDKTD